MLRRKIDDFLLTWKKAPNHKPLIIKGARQIGKTTSIEAFGKTYKSFIEVNFLLEPTLKNIFAKGYSVDSVIKELSLQKPNSQFIPHDTLILFDEIQAFPDATTSLKSFCQDRKFDVICSGSLLGINYSTISSIAVGYKEDFEMHSLDFEEFLWALGYKDDLIDDLFSSMKELKPLDDGVFQIISSCFQDYIFCGGMPEIVNTFINEKNFSNVFLKQKQLFQDYQDDITKYVNGLDKSRVQNLYKHITPQLAKENHKYQISKLGHGARNRDYIGCEDWLKDAGIINLAYSLSNLSLPLAGNEDYSNYRIYYQDTSLLVASLDDDAKTDLNQNKNFGIYSGALFENLVSEALVKEGYDLHFYRSEDSTIELDFVIRVKNELVPVEVKAKRGRTKSLNAVISNPKNHIHYGVKLSKNNIGFDGKIFTFPYFLSFLLKRFFSVSNQITWKEN